jgi:hypothetical protein
VIRSTKTPAQKRERTLRLKQKHATWAQFPTATPAKVELDIKWTRDHRMIYRDTKIGYALKKITVHFMHIRDKGLCCICGEYVPLEEATFEHTDLRSGGHRNDQPEYWRNGELIKNGVAHARCNLERGSKRVPYLPHAAKGMQ